MMGQTEMTAAFRAGDVSEAAAGYRMRVIRSMRYGGVGVTQDAFATRIGMTMKGYQSIEGGKAHLLRYYWRRWEFRRSRLPRSS